METYMRPYAENQLNTLEVSLTVFLVNVFAGFLSGVVGYYTDAFLPGFLLRTIYVALIAHGVTNRKVWSLSIPSEVLNFAIVAYNFFWGPDAVNTRTASFHHLAFSAVSFSANTLTRFRWSIDRWCMFFWLFTRPLVECLALAFLEGTPKVKWIEVIIFFCSMLVALGLQRSHSVALIQISILSGLHIVLFPRFGHFWALLADTLMVLCLTLAAIAISPALLHGLNPIATQLWLAVMRSLVALVNVYHVLGPSLWRMLVWIEDSHLEPSASFVYRPLENTSEQFRILVLRRRRLFRLPSCNLEVARVQDETEFSACSYVWGSNNLTRRILVDNKQFLVTESAYQLLYQQQSFLLEKRLWIDAVCIDQSNSEEKQDQIAHMQLIYGRAKCVEAYLSYGFRNTNIQNLLYMLATTASRAQLVYNMNTIEVLTLISNNLEEWNELADLLRLPYFKRMWIIQEVSLATNLFINIGMTRIPWDNFACVIDTLDSQPLEDCFSKLQRLRTGEITPNLHMPAKLMAFARQEAEEHGVLSLFWLLLEFRSSSCAMPRDKVFALYGLVSAECRNQLPVDYKCTDEQLFTRVMRYLIAEEGFMPLTCCGDSLEEANIPRDNFPTWVVNWATPSSHGFFGTNIPTWQAATQLTPTYDLDSTGTKLLVDLSIIDRLSDSIYIAPLSPKATAVESSEYEKYRYEWMSDISRMLLTQAGDEAGERISLKRALYRVLTMDFEDQEDNVTLNWMTDTFDSDYTKFERWYGLRVSYESSMACMVQRGLEDVETETLDASDGIVHANKVWRRFRCINRRIGVTEKGRIGNFPRNMLPDDEICLIAGAPAPFVVRKAPRDSTETSDSRYIVGSCYIHGIMDGSLAQGPWTPYYLK